MNTSEQPHLSRQNNTPYDIFISYSRHDDKPFVEQLYNSLVEQGFHVWWDRESMESLGKPFWDEIEDAISSAERLILVVGPEAVKSPYVQREWQFALDLCKVVNPILRMGDFKLIPQEIPNVHYVDFSADRDYQGALDELLRSLKDAIAPLGAFYGEPIPKTPISFLDRPTDITCLEQIILNDPSRTAALTSAQQTAALKGMGGIGKSVLAATFARACNTRRVFPDGVIWLTAGVQAPVIESKLLLIGEAFEDAPDHYSNVESAKLRLARILQDKVCLIIVDDVWHASQSLPRAVRAVMGPRCRMLVTTRDNEVATALGAKVHPVELLSDEQALRLLADWVEVPVEQLPPEAQAVTRECANLPFALALCGAMRRGGTEWRDLLDRLRQADLEFIDKELPDYPYRDILKALHVGVEALEQENPNDAMHYTELAVFPTDESVPEDAVVTFWLHTNGLRSEAHARQLLVRLSNKALVRLEDEGSVRRVALHDLQHDYLRARLRDLGEMHAKLLSAYQEMCSDGWHTGPNDGYFFQRLPYHLAGAGRKAELRQLLLDRNWLEAKLAATGALALIGDYNLIGAEDSSYEKERDQFLFTQALPVLAALTEGGDINALMLEDVLVGRMIEYGQQNPDEVEQFCCQLLYSRFDSLPDRLRRLPHGYRFAVTVANELQLTDVLKRASIHPDKNIRNAALYAAYLWYRRNPEISMEILRHATQKIWRGVLPNFSAMYSALTLTLILGMGYYATPEGPQRRAEMIEAWLPVVRRLPVGGRRGKWIRRIARPVVRMLFSLVIRVVVFQIGANVDEKALFSVPDTKAALPVPPRARPHLKVMLEHYQHVWDKDRWDEFRIEDLEPHLKAVLLDEDVRIRNNIVVMLCFFASLLPWARRDPVTTAQLARELFEAAKAHRGDFMNEASPMVNTIVWTVGNSSKPASPEGVDSVLENYGTLFYEFEEIWYSRCSGLASKYRLGDFGMHLGLYYRWRGTADAPAIRRFLDLLIERSDTDRIKWLLESLGGSGNLVDMDILPINRATIEHVGVPQLRMFLNALRRIDNINPADFAVVISDAFINLKGISRDEVDALLKEEDEFLVTGLMRERIKTARRNPDITGILGSVAAWFATAATQADDPMGRLALGNLFGHLVEGQSLAQALVDYVEYYLSGI